jgi:hypothetical protein
MRLRHLPGIDPRWPNPLQTQPITDLFVRFQKKRRILVVAPA